MSSTVTDTLATSTMLHSQIVAQSQNQIQSGSSPQEKVTRQPVASQEESGELPADLAALGHQLLQLDSASPDEGIYEVLIQGEGESSTSATPQFSGTAAVVDTCTD